MLNDRDKMRHVSLVLPKYVDSSIKIDTFCQYIYA